MTVDIAERKIGPGEPCYLIAEIGANHNGDLAIALDMIRAAKDAGADVVKFQKRSLPGCIPVEQRDVVRSTPWGLLTYSEYRERLEFNRQQYEAIDVECRRLGIAWTASVWDEGAVDFLRPFHVPFVKIPSACLTGDGLLRAARTLDVPVVLSVGMSTPDEIARAVTTLGRHDLILLYCKSTYPCPTADLNLHGIATLRRLFGDEIPVGYSGHEVGLPTTLAAVALGACVVERHFTLSRAMWGTDQAASVEPPGFRKLVASIRTIEGAMGDGVIRVLESEEPIKAKLRRRSA